jgi:hypothetical protein
VSLRRLHGRNILTSFALPIRSSLHHALSSYPNLRSRFVRWEMRNSFGFQGMALITKVLAGA